MQRLAAKTILHQIENKNHVRKQNKWNYKRTRFLMEVFGHFCKYKPGICRLLRAKLNNTVPSYWVKNAPQIDEKNPTIVLYCHGGSFVAGSSNSHRCLLSDLYKALQNHSDPNQDPNRDPNRDSIYICSVNYRLAPEYPFPTGLLDCIRAYRQVIRKYPTASICVAGDSAGGNLALGVLLFVNKPSSNLPNHIRSVVLLSPASDLTVSRYFLSCNQKDSQESLGCRVKHEYTNQQFKRDSSSSIYHHKDWLDFSLDDSEKLANWYLGFPPPKLKSQTATATQNTTATATVPEKKHVVDLFHYGKTPFVSPLFADYSTVDPSTKILIQVGENEMLLDSCCSLHDRLQQFPVGQNSQLEIYPDSFHDFQMFDLPQSRVALANIERFIRS